MLNGKYLDYLYQVEGEEIKKSPKSLFNSENVYLIIDKHQKMIWIWSGKESRLFHRYIASSWAGKLKSRKQFYNFDYEIVRQGREPEIFMDIYTEIDEGRIDLKYPGESRTFKVQAKKINSKNFTPQISNSKLSSNQKSKIYKILSEISEMQMHIKYSIDHINKRISEIKKIMQ